MNHVGRVVPPKFGGITRQYSMGPRAITIGNHAECRDNCRWLGELLPSVPSSLVVGTMMYVDRGYDVPLCLAGYL